MKYLIAIFLLIPFICKAQGYTDFKFHKTVKINGVVGRTDTLLVPVKDNYQEKVKLAGPCQLSFDNTTGYFIDIWLGKYYLGRLVPHSGSIKFRINHSADWSGWYAKNIRSKLSWQANSYCNENTLFTLSER